MFKILLALLMCSVSLYAQQSNPGSRTVMDAHNCYPYFEWWGDRIDRALSAGTPVAIEQDLAWHTDPKTGRSWSVVTHGLPTHGNEPTMDQYFFERVRPTVEKALGEGNHGNWPLITLNLDFKDNKPEHLAAVLSLLRKYQPWLTTTLKGTAEADVQPLDVKPILVLTGEPDAQQTVFYDQLQSGDRILLFGAIHTEGKDPEATACEWTPAKMVRLRALVDRAHANGLWIRFYTLDGATKAQLSCNGWFHDYNFGSLAAARVRWRAAIDAHVDYLASDQYELVGQEIHQQVPPAAKK